MAKPYNLQKEYCRRAVFFSLLGSAILWVLFAVMGYMGILDLSTAFHEADPYTIGTALLGFKAGLLITGWFGTPIITLIGIWYLIVHWVESEKLKVSDETRLRIEKAFESVRELALKSVLTPLDWKELIKIHEELERTPTDVLEKRLRDADVFNPYAVQYLKGKTLEEALTLSLWQSRHDKNEATLRAIEQEHARQTIEAATAPDLRKRRELEEQKAAIEQEIARLSSQKPQPRWETPDD